MNTILRDIVYDARKNTDIRGENIIAHYKECVGKNRHILKLSDCVHLFVGKDPVLERMKEKVDGDTVFIFCINDIISTPYFTNGDQSVLYFCWIEYLKKWYSSHWRTEDTWNVIVATLVYEQYSLT